MKVRQALNIIQFSSSCLLYAMGDYCDSAHRYIIQSALHHMLRCTSSTPWLQVQPKVRCRFRCSGWHLRKNSVLVRPQALTFVRRKSNNAAVQLFDSLFTLLITRDRLCRRFNSRTQWALSEYDVTCSWTRKKWMKFLRRCTFLFTPSTC